MLVRLQTTFLAHHVLVTAASRPHYNHRPVAVLYVETLPSAARKSKRERTFVDSSIKAGQSVRDTTLMECLKSANAAALSAVRTAIDDHHAKFGRRDNQRSIGQLAQHLHDGSISLHYSCCLEKSMYFMPPQEQQRVENTVPTYELQVPLAWKMLHINSDASIVRQICETHPLVEYLDEQSDCLLSVGIVLAVISGDAIVGGHSKARCHGKTWRLIAMLWAGQTK